MNKHNTFESLLTQETYDRVWKEADDVIESTRTLGEIYPNVPEGLKEIPIQIFEVHIFPERFRDRITAFLENEEYSNSKNFITENL